MKFFILFFAFSICVNIGADAQSVTIDPRANTTPIMDIKSTTEGMVMPKMTVAQRNAITGLTAGTQVYCTNCTPYGPYSYDGGSWLAMFQTQTVSPITYTVGQAAQGGIVFWIDPASGGQHGLVAGKYDSETGPFDESSGGSTPLKLGFYGGASNTKMMVESPNLYWGIFSRCESYLGDNTSYGDWYIPAREELRLMYTLRNTIGGFATQRYWSSSLFHGASDAAWYVDFSNGQVDNGYKKTSYRTRPIRRF